MNLNERSDSTLNADQICFKNYDDPKHPYRVTDVRSSLKNVMLMSAIFRNSEVQ